MRFEKFKSHNGDMSKRTHEFLKKLINEKVVVESALVKIFESNLSELNQMYQHLVSLGYSIKRKRCLPYKKSRIGSKGLKGQMYRNRNVMIVVYYI